MRGLIAEGIWGARLRPSEPVHFSRAANFRRQASHRQSENRVRSSASTAGSRRMAAHQHPASCLQLNGAPQREHFFSTIVGTAKSMALTGCSPATSGFQ
jgi:hypothetical protein